MLGFGKTSPRPAMGLYTIYDRVAEEAGPCFLAVNDAVAIRGYRQTLLASQVVAEDEYHLFRIGSYDSKTMDVRPEKPVRVMVAPIVDDVTHPRLPGIEEAVNV